MLLAVEERCPARFDYIRLVVLQAVGLEHVAWLQFRLLASVIFCSRAEYL